MKDLKHYINILINEYLNENSKQLNKNIYTNKNVHIGDIFDESDIYSYSQKIHNNYDDFIDGDIGKRIEKYKKYIVKNINISDINIDEFYIDEHLVDRYREEFRKTRIYPPVILNSKLRVIDGTHRLNALNDEGVKKVICFVGFKS